MNLTLAILNLTLDVSEVLVGGVTLKMAADPDQRSLQLLNLRPHMQKMSVNWSMHACRYQWRILACLFCMHAVASMHATTRAIMCMHLKTCKISKRAKLF